jgi:hypothetical protein
MFKSNVRLSHLRLVLVLTVCGILIFSEPSKAADGYTVGQKVEVREGDTWTPASVIGHEGRKYKIHYDGSDATTDEWVGLDRIRNQLGAGSATAVPLTTGTPATRPSTAANAGLNIGDHIEAKWGGLWRKAVVISKSKDWTLVQYDNVWYEWVQPWRLRQAGSTDDTDQDSSPRGFVQKSTPAPTQTPEELSKNPVTHRLANDPDPDDFHISEKIGAGGIAITKVDRDGHEIGPSNVAGTPAPDAPVTLTSKLIGLNHGKFPGGSNVNLLYTPQGSFAVVASMPANWRDPRSIQRIDLKDGKAASEVTLAANVVPLAISMDGTRLITRSDKFFPATKWRLDLWTADTDTPKPLLSFRPYPSGPNGTDQVLWAEFVDASHVLTCSGGHTLCLWEISDTSVKQIYSLKGDTTTQPKLSAGGTYVMLGYGRQVLVCQALTGKCVAQSTALVDTDGMVGDINPDISRLALCGGSRLVICDLHHDKILMDVGLPIGVTGSDIGWMGPNLVLIDNQWVFDISHRAMVWQFTTERDRPIYCHWLGNSLSVVTNDGSATLGFVNLLDSKVMDADKQLADGQCEIQRGTKVSLQVNVPGPTAEQDKITRALTRRIQAAGLIIAPDQPIQLVAEVKDFDPRQVTYRGMGRNRGNSETVTVSKTVEVLSFNENSKPIWSVNSAVSGSAPMVVMHKANESIAEELQRQKNSKLDWFTTIEIPQDILRPVDPAGSCPLASMMRSPGGGL